MFAGLYIYWRLGRTVGLVGLEVLGVYCVDCDLVHATGHAPGLLFRVCAAYGWHFESLSIQSMRL